MGTCPGGAIPISVKKSTWNSILSSSSSNAGGGKSSSFSRGFPIRGDLKVRLTFGGILFLVVRCDFRERRRRSLRYGH